MNIKRFLFLPITFALFLIPCLGQEKVDESKPLVKIIKRAGWNIPAVTKEELSSNKVINIEKVSVTVKGYKLKKGIDFQLDYYFLDADNSLITFAKEVELKTIGSFSANGKIYAYSANCVPFGRTSDGFKVYIGILIRLYYFDEDGDGKFETRYTVNKLPNTIPNWVTNGKS